jgi:hypothetical protein
VADSPMPMRVDSSLDELLPARPGEARVSRTSDVGNSDSRRRLMLRVRYRGVGRHGEARQQQTQALLGFHGVVGEQA